jgi:hypothetical protein
MDFYKLIPKKFRHLPNWSTNKKYLLFKKIHNIPVLYVEDNIVFVFLDLRIRKEIIAIIKHLNDIGVDFYFTHPDFSNPSEEYSERDVIYHYLRCWADQKFHKEVNKINFDFVNNLTNWVKNYSSFQLLKTMYDDFLKVVNRKWHDYYSQKEVWDYSEEIREEFRTLWRDIQINNIL